MCFPPVECFCGDHGVYHGLHCCFSVSSVNFPCLVDGNDCVEKSVEVFLDSFNLPAVYSFSLAGDVFSVADA